MFCVRNELNTALLAVINPAERNALVGIKPTVGLTSRAGYVIVLSFREIGYILIVTFLQRCPRKCSSR